MEETPQQPTQQTPGKKINKKKNFFAKIMDKLDKKLEEQAKDASCCSDSNNGKGKSCC